MNARKTKAAFNSQTRARLIAAVRNPERKQQSVTRLLSLGRVVLQLCTQFGKRAGMFRGID